MPLYQVSRLTEQWQIVEANSKEEAIENALHCGEWDTDGFITKNDELYYGYNVVELED